MGLSAITNSISGCAQPGELKSPRSHARYHDRTRSRFVNATNEPSRIRTHEPMGPLARRREPAYCHVSIIVDTPAAIANRPSDCRILVEAEAFDRVIDALAQDEQQQSEARPSAVLLCPTRRQPEGRSQVAGNTELLVAAKRSSLVTWPRRHRLPKPCVACSA
jgi:hypothetical protein